MLLRCALRCAEMKRHQRIVTSTNIDSHGEANHPDALQDLVESRRAVAGPLLVNHDWRLYIGRSTCARIVQLDNGHTGIECDLEVFESADSIPAYDSANNLPRLSIDPNSISFDWDSNHLLESDQEFIADLQKIIPQHSSLLRQKTGLEPASTVLFCLGAFTVGGVAGGFLKAAGADIYAGLKRVILNWAKKPENTNRTLLLKVVTDDLDHSYEVLVYFLAEAAENGDVLDDVWKQLGNLLPSLNAKKNKLHHVVFEYGSDGLHRIQRIRQDGVPLDMGSIPTVDVAKMGMSTGSIVTRFQQEE